MTIAKVNMKSQITKHTKVAKKYETVAMEVHILACEDLQHAMLHGDVSLCKHLYDALGGQNPSHARTASLKAWFVLMSGEQMTAEKGDWKLKKGWKAENFKLEEAENTPYWSLAAEADPKHLTIEAMLNIMRNFSKRIDKASENGTFDGDASKAKELFSNVVSFAEERAKRLTAQEQGKPVAESVLIPGKAAKAAQAKAKKRVEENVMGNQAATA